MDSQTRNLIEQIHARPHQVVLALTGGGASAAADLLAVPGALRTILEVVVPYDEHALIAFLGHRPENFCSVETSQALARRAFERACWLVGQDSLSHIAGLGCTASLVSDRPKRGPHRFHICWRNAERTAAFSLTMNKGARDRQAEEKLVAAAVLNAVAGAFDIKDRVRLDLLAEEEVKNDEMPITSQACILINADGQTMAGGGAWDTTGAMALLPGSFNPAHEGHWQLAAVARRLLSMPVAFELSIDNVDKPALSAAEIRKRVAQFAWRASIWLTRAPTFIKKARLFPGAVFVVGADTAERIIAPRYYEGGAAGMLAALAEMQQLGCRFLVAGRVAGDGRYQSLDEFAVPGDFRPLFAAIAREDFHVNISSTELRQQLLS